jgi:hypothetical protein
MTCVFLGENKSSRLRGSSGLVDVQHGKPTTADSWRFIPVSRRALKSVLGAGQDQTCVPLCGYSYHYPLLAPFGPGLFGCCFLGVAELAVAVRVEFREQLLAAFRIWPALSAWAFAASLLPPLLHGCFGGFLLVWVELPVAVVVLELQAVDGELLPRVDAEAAFKAG